MEEEDDVPLIALELSGVSTQDAVTFVGIGGEMASNQAVYLDRLFLAKERNDTKASATFCVFRLLDRSTN